MVKEREKIIFCTLMYKFNPHLWIFADCYRVSNRVRVPNGGILREESCTDMQRCRIFRFLDRNQLSTFLAGKTLPWTYFNGQLRDRS